MSQRAEKVTPQDELEELLGFKPEPEGEDESQPGIVEDDAPAPEPEPEPEEPAETSDETPEDATSGDDGPEELPAAAKAPERVESAAERREKALRAEIAKLRQAARQREQSNTMQFAPPPTQAVPVEPAQKKPTGVPVRVSEDGSSVYVDPAELERLIEERAARTLEERMKPTPEQVQQAMAQRTINAFVAENPERHAPLVQEAGQAIQYLKLSLRQALQTTGATAYTPEDLVAVARETGLDQQFAEFFPEIAPHFEEFVEANAAENPAWQARIMRRIAASLDQAEAPTPITSAPKLRSVAAAPRSLAAKGGQRSPSPSVDQQEFDGLEREFRRDVVFFPPEKRRRMEELGKKLGKAGYV